MSTGLRPVTAEAPGRLDFLGGVADYSGSLVLEMPTRARTTVSLEPLNADEARIESPSFGTAVVELEPLRLLHRKQAPLHEFRHYLEAQNFAPWARYPIGCLIVLSAETSCFPESGFILRINSTVPENQGVSSSAALEIATLRAFNTAMDLGLSAIELARLGQHAENVIVGASCGLMDQLASSCGTPGTLLPILCRPDLLSPTVSLPKGLTILGWPSGVKHSVGAAPYATARAAAFMGKRLTETLTGQKWNYTSEIPPNLFQRIQSDLPDALLGRDFLSSHAGTDDPLTHIDPDRLYPVRAATRFPIEENARVQRGLQIFANHPLDPQKAHSQLRALLLASHQGYSAMGLGAAETDAMVDRLIQQPLDSGVIGGRISGGGSGGTVVVLLTDTAAQRFAEWTTDHPAIY